MSLYKYVVPDRIDILQNARIRFSQAAAMNDPFELRPHFEQFAEDEFIRRSLMDNSEIAGGFEIGCSIGPQVLDELEKIFPGKEHKKELDEIRNALPPRQVLIQQARESYPSFVNELVGIMKANITYFKNVILTDISDNVGVLSLTKKCDNILMWAHYANNYKGFVIEFDEKHKFFNSQNVPEGTLGGLREVEYSDVRPNRRLLLEMTPNEIFLIKSKEWEYEQEWRMIVYLDKSKGFHLTKEGKPILDAEDLPVYLYPFPPACIKGIIFGSRMTEDNKNKISGFLSRDKRYAHVKKYQSVLDEKTFKLHILPSR